MDALNDRTLPLDVLTRAADAGLALVNAMAEKRRMVRESRSLLWSNQITQAEFIDTCESARQIVARAEHQLRQAVAQIDDARQERDAAIQLTDVPY